MNSYFYATKLFTKYYNEYHISNILCLCILPVLCTFLHFQIFHKCMEIRNLITVLKIATFLWNLLNISDVVEHQFLGSTKQGRKKHRYIYSLSVTRSALSFLLRCTKNKQRAGRVVHAGFPNVMKHSQDIDIAPDDELLTERSSRKRTGSFVWCSRKVEKQLVDRLRRKILDKKKKRWKREEDVGARN